MGLTERQKLILDFIDKYVREKSRPPTIREICAAANIFSASVVNYNLIVLQDHGLLPRAVSSIQRGWSTACRAGSNKLKLAPRVN